MDSYEWNKIAGWVLAAAAIVLGLSIGTSYLYPDNAPETPAYVVEGVESDDSAAGPTQEAEKPIAFYLASADASKGETVFKKCAACHKADKGAGNGMGPNLYGVLGAHHAHLADFAYSDAMKATAEKTWDWDSMSQWVENPKAYIPGNKMSFAGLKKPEDRANLLTFLNSKSDNPLPLPEVPAEPEEDASDDANAGAEDDGDAAAEADETEDTETTDTEEAVDA